MAQKVDDALANVKKAAEALEEPATNPLDKKDEYYDAVSVVEVPKPYNGATSFAEVQEALKARKTEYAVSDLYYVFDQIVQNIKTKPDEEMTPSEKADATVAAAKELAGLLNSPLTSLTKVGLADTKDDKRPIFERIKDFVFGAKEGYGSAFWSFVDNKGDWRWLSAYSNNFKDNDDEIFTEAAHKEFVRAAYKLNRLPELWVWHTPGSRIGQCDFLDMSDGFIVASGTYDEPETMGPKVAAKAAELGVSHGFQYPADTKENGVFHRYFDFEISVLPQRRAANPHMPLANVLKEGSKMTFEKRAELVDFLGEDKTTALEAALGDKKEELLTSGIDWKEVSAALAEPTASVSDSDPKPDPKPDPDPDLAARVGKIEETLSKVTESQGVLAEATKEIVTQLTDLKRTKDEIIAEEMAPRRPAPLDPDKRPSQSKETEIDATKLSAEALAELRGDKETEPVNPAAKYVTSLIGQ